MSRYVVTAKDPHTHICIVGYDQPLQTYFAQVLERATFDAEELRDMKAEELLYDDENIALWIDQSLRDWYDQRPPIPPRATRYDSSSGLHAA